MRVELLRKKMAEHMELANEYRKKYRQNKSRETLDALSMNCFQAVNYLIDLGEMAALKPGRNLYLSTYREIFEELKSKKVLSQEEFRVATTLVSLRNRIAHEYHIIKPEDVELMALYVSKLEPIIAKLAKAAQ